MIAYRECFPSPLILPRTLGGLRHLRFGKMDAVNNVIYLKWSNAWHRALKILRWKYIIVRIERWIKSGGKRDCSKFCIIFGIEMERHQPRDASCITYQQLRLRSPSKSRVICGLHEVGWYCNYCRECGKLRDFDYWLEAQNMELLYVLTRIFVNKN